MRRRHALSAAFLSLLSCTATAAPVAIINAGFEDPYNGGDVPVGNFPVGPAPNGWTIHDPDGIVGPQVFVGVLNPGTSADYPAGAEVFFPGGAAEGDNAALLFADGRDARPAYGIEQTLDAALAPNTRYSLRVAVGNIASGTGLGASAGFGYANLDGFPGYQVQLRAGDTLLAMDDSSLLPGEGLFAESEVSFTTGALHAALGQALTIRLISLNGAGGPIARGIEVDFDDVRLDATAVPLPAGIGLLAAGLGMLGLRRRRD
ncbi:MAG: VPLPA-CTERM sorting domain-containing protein [Gammaproteobacteria bacterium]